MNNVGKTIGKYVLIFIIMITGFIISLSLTSFIPQSAIKKKVMESSEFLNGKSVTEYFGIKNIILDTWSDAVMLNTAYCIDTHNVFESLLRGRRSYDPDRELINIRYKEDEVLHPEHSENPISDLSETLSNTNEYSYEYARYWHGYLILLRPLLTIFNYQTIRILFTVIINVLAIIFLYCLYKKGDIFLTFLIAIGLITFSYYIVGLSMQYFAVTVIFLISSILILTGKKATGEMFFIIGGLTAFFDLFSSPLLTLRNSSINDSY